MVRNTVTISFSCKPETYKKILEIKEAIEADRLESVAMSQVIDRLINLGIAYREYLRLNKQQELQTGQIDVTMVQRKLPGESKT